MSIIEIIDKVTNFAVKNEHNILKALNYFKKYGYLRKVMQGEHSLEDVLLAIRRFQDISGVPQTGIIDGKTLRLMDYPRCSLPDFYDDIPDTEEAALPGDNLKWAKKDLNYFISSYDTDMNKDLWYATIRRAFDNISSVCNLKFTLVNNINEANLVLGTGRGSRDDFDGSSGTLAWFQLPNSFRYIGRLSGKFDLDEFWLGLNQSGRGIRLLNVATHEICHGLGLRHSKVKTALMAPFYSAEIALPQQNDDIIRLRGLYGESDTIIPDPLPPPPQNNKLIINIEGSISNIQIPGYRVTKVS